MDENSHAIDNSWSNSGLPDNEDSVENQQVINNDVKEEVNPSGDEIEMEEIDTDTFYLRYYIGHQGRYGHEFMEITISDDGVLRYSNISNYKKAASIQKEVRLSTIVVDEFKKMIEKSKIMQSDDSEWPEPDANGKQEIEIVSQGHHISFLCNKFTSSAELRNASEDLWSFYYLTQDLKVFVFSIISLHFKVKPIPT